LRVFFAPVASDGRHVVVVAEDEPLLKLFMVDALDDAGYEVC
jgi:hypothetical protein